MAAERTRCGGEPFTLDNTLYGVIQRGVPAHELCHHCKAKMARFYCIAPGCAHRLCSWCIVWGAGDSGWCDDCKRGGVCRVKD